jgi:acyl-coenzyme A thioesterase PaaI-like protein
VDIAELPLHKSIGLTHAPDGSTHTFELTESATVQNHLGSVHAGVQFVLAEACSGEFLLREIGKRSKVSGMLIAASVKFRSAAHGKLFAAARFSDDAKGRIIAGASEKQVFVRVLVDIRDTNGSITMEGRYDWLLQPKPAS